MRVEVPVVLGTEIVGPNGICDFWDLVDQQLPVIAMSMHALPVTMLGFDQKALGS